MSKAATIREDAAKLVDAAAKNFYDEFDWVAGATMERLAATIRAMPVKEKRKS